MTTQAKAIPMTAISRSVIQFISSEFPAGVSQKVLDAYAANSCLPDTIWHDGKAHPVKERFYDWYLSKTPAN